MSVLAGVAPVEGPTADVLERVAVALSSSLELGDVLEILAQIGLEAIAADRASVLLLDEGRLLPAAAIAIEHNDALFDVFREMPGVELDDMRANALLAGRAIVIDDPRNDPLLPEGWAERFSLHTLVVVPLVARGEPCGVIALDWTSPRSFVPGELGLLESIGAYAGVAVSNARLFVEMRRRAQLQAALARAAASLSLPLLPEDVADRLADAYADLLGTRITAVALFDLERRLITRVAARGTAAVMHPRSLDDFPAHLVERVEEMWNREQGPIDLGRDASLAGLFGSDAAGVTSYLLFPLIVGGCASGVAVLGFADHARLDAEELAAAEALAAIAAAALERHALVERRDEQLRRLDALHRVSSALTEGADASAMVSELNELLDGHGVEVLGITLRDRRWVSYLGGDEPTVEERAAWRMNSGAVALDGNVLSIPMRLGRRLVGMLRVRPAALTNDERAFLEALATGLADVANRSVARAEAEEDARQRAVADERDRIRADLHDTAGQMFVALGLLAARHAEMLEPGSQQAAQANRLVDLASDGKWAIDQAIRALAFVPNRRGLLASLRSLARTVQSDSGIIVHCTPHGDSTAVDAEVERALFRVATEAVSNAWRHGKPTTIDIALDVVDGHIELRVADDGVGFAGCASEATGHRGIEGMKRAVAAVGGALRVASDTGGAVVTARVPA